MQLGSFRERFTPGQLRRRAAKVRRRAWRGALEPARPVPPRQRGITLEHILRFAHLGGDPDYGISAPPEKKRRRRPRVNYRVLRALAFADRSKLKARDGLVLHSLKKALHLARSS